MIDLNAVYDEHERALWDAENESMDETVLLHASTYTRLAESHTGSVMVTYSRRDLVRKHRAKTRAILRARRPVIDA